MRRLAFALIVSFAILSCTQSARIEVSDAWARDTVGRTDNVAVFMIIRSDSPDRLIAASSPVANKTDLMTMGGGGTTMEMKYIKFIDIPANKPVSLDPSGLHVWLAGLKQPLRAGESFPLTLRFAAAGERQIIVSVIRPSAAPPTSGM